MEEVHRVSVPKPQEGERLGLTVQQQNKCVVVTRILSGGLVDQVSSSSSYHVQAFKPEIMTACTTLPVYVPLP